MKRTKMLICDKDHTYLEALVGYLLGENNNYEITCCSDIDEFIAGYKSYDIRLLTREFIDVDGAKSLFKEKHEGMYQSDESDTVDIQLLGADEQPIDGMNHLYKFQNMKSFVEKLTKFTIKEFERRVSDDDSKLIGIYSPSHHRLKLPFSFVYSNICKKRGKVLMIDLEASSMMNRMVGRKPEYNLTDFLYALSDEDEDVSIGDYVYFYEGIAMVAPVENPSELWEITSSGWKKFVDKLKKSPFDYVVLVIGEMSGNYLSILQNLSELILVEGIDDYSNLCLNQYEDFLQRNNYDASVHEVRLDDKKENFARNYKAMDLMEDSPDRWVGNVKKISFQRAAIG